MDGRKGCEFGWGRCDKASLELPRGLVQAGIARSLADIVLPMLHERRSIRYPSNLRGSGQRRAIELTFGQRQIAVGQYLG